MTLLRDRVIEHYGPSLGGLAGRELAEMSLDVIEAALGLFGLPFPELSHRSMPN